MESAKQPGPGWTGRHCPALRLRQARASRARASLAAAPVSTTTAQFGAQHKPFRCRRGPYETGFNLGHHTHTPVDANANTRGGGQPRNPAPSSLFFLCATTSSNAAVTKQQQQQQQQQQQPKTHSHCGSAGRQARPVTGTADKKKMERPKGVCQKLGTSIRLAARVRADTAGQVQGPASNARENGSA